MQYETNGTDNQQREQYHLWTKYILREKKSGHDISPEAMMGNKRFRKKMEDCYKYQDLLLQIPFSGHWVKSNEILSASQSAQM
eukprot:451039-Hanusia_phi.AAC.1